MTTRCVATMITLLGTALLASGPCAAAETPDATAKSLAGSSGLPGGFCVVLGRTDVALPMALADQGRFVVQALCNDPAAIAELRETIRATGVYGRVSADGFDGGRLPYAENLISLIVADRYSALAERGLAIDEVLRVLAPLGTAYLGDSAAQDDDMPKWIEGLKSKLASAGIEDVQIVRADGVWLKVTKPYPDALDQWPHYLHGPDGNPVAEDEAVGPPAHYQWIAGPRWLRSHESDSSVRTLVTSAGRLFAIVDEAPASILGPQGPPDKWFLTARDAFGGVSLWKVPITDWGWHAWKPSWFTPRPGGIPLNIEKRLVAVDDRVYVTLGYRAPVSQLDARTGEILREYENTERTAEILYLDGRLVLTLLEDGRARVAAVDAETGRRLWTSKNAYRGTTVDYYRFTSMRGRVTPAKVDPTLNTATDGSVVALIDGGDLVCIDYATGEEKWRTAFPLVEADHNAGRIDAGQNLWAGTMIVRDGVVVHASPNQLAAFDAGSGNILWQQPKKYLGHLWYEWKDVFVIDGLVWTWSAELEREKLAGGGRGSTWPATVNGYGLHSGELKNKVPLGKIFKTHHHHRCYRNKATSRYILASRRGTEYVDLDEGDHTVHNWVRGTCHVGMMPANGLLYAPPHPCQCYIDEKLNGFIALAAGGEGAKGRGREGERGRQADGGRLERGPAYGQAAVHFASVSSHSSEDWPTFRHDSMRSGDGSTEVPARPRRLWQKQLGRKVGPPTVAGGRAFVPLVDEHHVVAVDAADGKELWAFGTGARIDSPPTYVPVGRIANPSSNDADGSKTPAGGLCIFGSADGHVYCVRADDGQLVWRFRAAPVDRRMGAFSQLESASPVHGSVLVIGDTAHFAAGRSSQLDGGIGLFALDALSGEVRHRATLEGPFYGVDDIEENYRLPMGCLPDILQGDERNLYMRKLVFNHRLERGKPTGPPSPRIYAPGGMLDDSYFKRIPWTLSTGGGYSRLIVHDENAGYHVRMFDSLQGLDPKVYFTPGEKGYLLFASDKQTGKQLWSRRVPVRVNAMVATGGVLFAAGPPDVIDPDDPLAAFEGRKGGLLMAVDAASGEVLWETKLDKPPVFNGAAAARGRLYLSLMEGQVVCFGG